MIACTPAAPVAQGRLARSMLVLALACAMAGCAPKRIEIPSDPGAPLADFQAVHAAISKECRAVRTLTGDLRLSGRAGDQPLRGVVVHSAFRRPDAMVLEMVAVSGTIFTLGAIGPKGTLVYHREQRALEGAPPDQILGALTGLVLAPADLLAILTGCVVPEPRATAGRRHANGWASIALDGGATLYLESAGGEWRLREARRDRLEVEYVEWPAGSPLPSRVRFLTASPTPVDLRAELTGIETNVALEDSLFVVRVRDEQPMTLEELRGRWGVGN